MTDRNVRYVTRYQMKKRYHTLQSTLNKLIKVFFLMDDNGKFDDSALIKGNDFEYKGSCGGNSSAGGWGMNVYYDKSNKKWVATMISGYGGGIFNQHGEDVLETFDYDNFFQIIDKCSTLPDCWVSEFANYVQSISRNFSSSIKTKNVRMFEINQIPLQQCFNINDMQTINYFDTFFARVINTHKVTGDLFSARDYWDMS